MTERIDLDELDAGEETNEDGPNPGDWFWREEIGPEDAPEAVTDVKTAATTESDLPETDSESSETGKSAGAESTDPASDSASDSASGPVPRVPRANEDKPAGIPMESGGAGAGTGADARADSDAQANANADAQAGADASTNASASAPEEPGTNTADEPSASGPHGGGADDMTLAFTYDAATELADFGRVAADATGWADWLGIVGDVPAHVLNKFQRDRNVDLDFFNGSARGPGERLADIDHHSMFYSERMVVVGIEGEDEEIAERADWEFVPLADAAEKAGWEITGDSPDGDGDLAGEGGDPVGEGGGSADADDDSPDEDGTSTE